MEFGSAFLGSYSEYHVKYGKIEPDFQASAASMTLKILLKIFET